MSEVQRMTTLPVALADLEEALERVIDAGPTVDQLDRIVSLIEVEATRIWKLEKAKKEQT